MEPGFQTGKTARKVRSVDEYIYMMKLQKKSHVTITDYRNILSYYAAFLGVPVSDLHKNLHPEDLMSYATYLDGHDEEDPDNPSKTIWVTHAQVTRKKYLQTVHRFMVSNGCVFDEEERKVVTAYEPEEVSGDPLTVDVAQKMLDLSTPQMKAIITFMCSTGARAGETSKLLLSDVGVVRDGKFVSDINGSVVNIRPEISKRRRGGLVFLTSEAREYLTLWMNARDEYIRIADIKSQNLRKGSTGRTKGAKHTGGKITRPENDMRLFACSYYTLSENFKNLYRIVGNGKTDKYGRGAVVPHRCRAFFRTNAAKTMGIDLTEGILRHSGYLNQSYVRMTPEEREREFHAGEAALYLTRADHRIQSGRLSQLERELAELKAEREVMKKLDAAGTDEIISEVMRRMRVQKTN